MAVREVGKTAGALDVYFFGPDGRRYRSKVAIARSFGYEDEPGAKRCRANMVVKEKKVKVVKVKAVKVVKVKVGKKPADAGSLSYKSGGGGGAGPRIEVDAAVPVRSSKRVMKKKEVWEHDDSHLMQIERRCQRPGGYFVEGRAWTGEAKKKGEGEKGEEEEEEEEEEEVFDATAARELVMQRAEDEQSMRLEKERIDRAKGLGKTSVEKSVVRAPLSASERLLAAAAVTSGRVLLLSLQRWRERREHGSFACPVLAPFPSQNVLRALLISS